MNRFQIKRILNEYFTLTRGDRSGIFVLLLLLLILIVVSIVTNKRNPGSKTDFSGVISKIREWEESGVKAPVHQKHLFIFDPNLINQEFLDSLDLPLNVKRNLVKYRESGGRFKNAGDLRKIYGMNDSIYNRIAVYVDIKKEESLKISPASEKKAHFQKQDFIAENYNKSGDNRGEIKSFSEPAAKLELNSADSTAFVRINGIGPVLASRIIRYRSLLGGFFSVDQLSEVYGLNAETYQKIRDQFIVDSQNLRKIRINFSEYGTLIRHPYIGKTHTNSIIKYRSANGPFKSEQDLLNSNLLDSAALRKVVVYLSFD